MVQLSPPPPPPPPAPSFTSEGVDRSIAIVGGSREASSKMFGRLPHYYTDVPQSQPT